MSNIIRNLIIILLIMSYLSRIAVAGPAAYAACLATCCVVSVGTGCPVCPSVCIYALLAPGP